MKSDNDTLSGSSPSDSGGTSSQTSSNPSNSSEIRTESSKSNKGQDRIRIVKSPFKNYSKEAFTQTEEWTKSASTQADMVSKFPRINRNTSCFSLLEPQKCAKNSVYETHRVDYSKAKILPEIAKEYKYVNIENKDSHLKVAEWLVQNPYHLKTNLSSNGNQPLFVKDCINNLLTYINGEDDNPDQQKTTKRLLQGHSHNAQKLERSNDKTNNFRRLCFLTPIKNKKGESSYSKLSLNASSSMKTRSDIKQLTNLKSPVRKEKMPIGTASSKYQSGDSTGCQLSPVENKECKHKFETKVNKLQSYSTIKEKTSKHFLKSSEEGKKALTSPDKDLNVLKTDLDKDIGEAILEEVQKLRNEFQEIKIQLNQESCSRDPDKFSKHLPEYLKGQYQDLLRNTIPKNQTLMNEMKKRFHEKGKQCYFK